MSKQKATALHFERRKQTVTAGQAANSFVRRFEMGRRSSKFAVLKSSWPDVVGQDMAKFTLPVRLTKRSGRYNLTLSVDPSMALLLSYNDGGVRNDVEMFLGDGKIDKISILQTGIPSNRRQQPVKTSPPLPSVSWDDANTMSRLGLESYQAPSQSIKDAGLATALERLAATIIHNRP